jgi:hypothetical protein
MDSRCSACGPVSSSASIPISARSIPYWSICSSVYLIMSSWRPVFGTSLKMYSTGNSKLSRDSLSRSSGRMKS